MYDYGQWDISFFGHEFLEGIFPGNYEQTMNKTSRAGWRPCGSLDRTPNLPAGKSHMRWWTGKGSDL